MDTITITRDLLIRLAGALGERDAPVLTGLEESGLALLHDLLEPLPSTPERFALTDRVWDAYFAGRVARHAALAAARSV